MALARVCGLGSRGSGPGPRKRPRPSVRHLVSPQTAMPGAPSYLFPPLILPPTLEIAVRAPDDSFRIAPAPGSTMAAHCCCAFGALRRSPLFGT